MSGAIPPDDVIPPRGERSVQLRSFARDAVLLVPNMLKLLGRLMRDPRVPRRSKLVIAAALAYVVSPVDLIPDPLIIGLADDLLVAAFAINHLVNAAGEDVVLEHWDGPRDLLDVIRGTLDVSSALVPVRLREITRRIAGA
jgi:uncharacterized membrane protein YkvA (DUF1232 family)